MKAKRKDETAAAVKWMFPQGLNDLIGSLYEAGYTPESSPLMQAALVHLHELAQWPVEKWGGCYQETQPREARYWDAHWSDIMAGVI